MDPGFAIHKAALLKVIDVRVPAGSLYSHHVRSLVKIVPNIPHLWCCRMSKNCHKKLKLAECSELQQYNTSPKKISASLNLLTSLDTAKVDLV